MIASRFSAIIALCVAVTPVSVFAASPVQISSSVFVEKLKHRQDGSVATVLEEPNLVTPGDNLVFVLKYKNAGTSPAEKFVVTNPLPKAVAFNGTSDGLEMVSVDGGKNWGFLSNMRLQDANGSSRPALMSDVTHVRWNLTKPIASGVEGKLIFRGIVR
jgi:uncharacterized repeat protein (TIGR01451 family)